MSTRPANILIIFGTRPEAIKLGPVIRQLPSESDYFRCVVAVTAQPREMVDQETCRSSGSSLPGHDAGYGPVAGAVSRDRYRGIDTAVRRPVSLVCQWALGRVRPAAEMALTRRNG